jgi:anti-sigma B factor antagonist
MKLITEQQSGLAIFTLRGRLVGPPETDELHDKILAYLERDTKNIIIDLRYVTWVSSMGIGSIMRCLMTVRNQGGDLRLANVTTKARDLLSITKVIGLIKTFDNVPQAVASFAI